MRITVPARGRLRFSAWRCVTWARLSGCGPQDLCPRCEIDEGSACSPRSLVASTGPSGPATISDQEYKFRPAARPQHAQHAEHTPSRVVHFRDDVCITTFQALLSFKESGTKRCAPNAESKCRGRTHQNRPVLLMGSCNFSPPGGGGPPVPASRSTWGGCRRSTLKDNLRLTVVCVGLRRSDGATDALHFCRRGCDMPLPAAAVVICRCFCRRPSPHSPSAWDVLTADECHGAARGAAAAVGGEMHGAAAGGMDMHVVDAEFKGHILREPFGLTWMSARLCVLAGVVYAGKRDAAAMMTSASSSCATSLTAARFAWGPLLISDGRETPARPVDMTARGDTSKSLRPFRGECKDAAAHCRGGGQMCFWKGGEGEASEYVGATHSSGDRKGGHSCNAPNGTQLPVLQAELKACKHESCKLLDKGVASPLRRAATGGSQADQGTPARRWLLRRVGVSHNPANAATRARRRRPASGSGGGGPFGGCACCRSDQITGSRRTIAAAAAAATTAPVAADGGGGAATASTKRPVPTAAAVVATADFGTAGADATAGATAALRPPATAPVPADGVPATSADVVPTARDVAAREPATKRATSDAPSAGRAPTTARVVAATGALSLPAPAVAPVRQRSPGRQVPVAAAAVRSASGPRPAPARRADRAGARGAVAPRRRGKGREGRLPPGGIHGNGWLRARVWSAVGPLAGSAGDRDGSQPGSPLIRLLVVAVAIVIGAAGITMTIVPIVSMRNFVMGVRPGRAARRRPVAAVLVTAIRMPERDVATLQPRDMVVAGRGRAAPGGVCVGEPRWRCGGSRQARFRRLPPRPIGVQMVGALVHIGLVREGDWAGDWSGKRWRRGRCWQQCARSPTQPQWSVVLRCIANNDTGVVAVVGTAALPHPRVEREAARRGGAGKRASPCAVSSCVGDSKPGLLSTSLSSVISVRRWRCVAADASLPRSLPTAPLAEGGTARYVTCRGRRPPAPRKTKRWRPRPAGRGTDDSRAAATRAPPPDAATGNVTAVHSAMRQSRSDAASPSAAAVAPSQSSEMPLTGVAGKRGAAPQGCRPRLPTQMVVTIVGGGSGGSEHRKEAHIIDVITVNMPSRVIHIFGTATGAAIRVVRRPSSRTQLPNPAPALTWPSAATITASMSPTPPLSPAWQTVNMALPPTVAVASLFGCGGGSSGNGDRGAVNDACSSVSVSPSPPQAPSAMSGASDRTPSAASPMPSSNLASAGKGRRSGSPAVGDGGVNEFMTGGSTCLLARTPAGALMRPSALSSPCVPAITFSAEPGSTTSGARSAVAGTGFASVLAAVSAAKCGEATTWRCTTSASDSGATRAMFPSKLTGEPSPGAIGATLGATSASLAAADAAVLVDSGGAVASSTTAEASPSDTDDSGSAASADNTDGDDLMSTATTPPLTLLPATSTSVVSR
ncbi:hypothetical protein BU14_0271s0007 [Porphyra umbilicalis]|uniref:Uncharacterized protein n=1 Tax=Porphyra umbilicalis TaxID=2786 RepID=A0A1X6P1H7_PORUM|nr:hypothetical protein BU14_0271s0007 [Porphyra umbilicalis]|eukprot:OSX74712.1 hypothetical protein BU14_0271s0007 [Porphyra umbilicalis]